MVDRLRMCNTLVFYIYLFMSASGGVKNLVTVRFSVRIGNMPHDLSHFRSQTGQSLLRSVSYNNTPGQRLIRPSLHLNGVAR